MHIPQLKPIRAHSAPEPYHKYQVPLWFHLVPVNYLMLEAGTMQLNQQPHQMRNEYPVRHL